MKLFQRKDGDESDTESVPEPLSARWWMMDAYQGQVVHLLHLVDMATQGMQQGRMVMFVAPVPKVGTSSVAWAYARASAEFGKRRVLLLDVADSTAIGQLLPTAPKASTNYGAEAGFITASRFATASVHTSNLQALIPEANLMSAVSNLDFWRDLSVRFDEVVIDSPAVSQSLLPMVIASQVDAVVMVVEADRTRTPVAEKVFHDLQAVRANVIGTVLNKRRYYVPDRVYRRL